MIKDYEIFDGHINCISVVERLVCLWHVKCFQNLKKKRKSYLKREPVV